MFITVLKNSDENSCQRRQEGLFLSCLSADSVFLKVLKRKNQAISSCKLRQNAWYNSFKSAGER